MTIKPSFPVGIVQVEETDEEGRHKYINKKIMDSVVIVEYRTFSLQEEVKTQMEKFKGLNAQVAYLQMISVIEIEVRYE